MKLGIINHIRCGDPTFDRTLVWLPDDMSEESFDAAIKAARAEYLAFAVQFKNEPPPNDYRQHTPVPYERFPNLKVAQVKAEWEEKKAAWELWDKQRQQARKTFGDYIDGHAGIVRFWKHEPPFTQECDWGHQHGVKLDYDETKFD